MPGEFRLSRRARLNFERSSKSFLEADLSFKSAPSIFVLFRLFRPLFNFICAGFRTAVGLKSLRILLEQLWGCRTFKNLRVACRGWWCF